MTLTILRTVGYFAECFSIGIAWFFSLDYTGLTRSGEGDTEASAILIAAYHGDTLSPVVPLDLGHLLRRCLSGFSTLYRYPRPHAVLFGRKEVITSSPYLTSGEFSSPS